MNQYPMDDSEFCSVASERYSRNFGDQDFDSNITNFGIDQSDFYEQYFVPDSNDENDAIDVDTTPTPSDDKNMIDLTYAECLKDSGMGESLRSPSNISNSAIPTIGKNNMAFIDHEVYEALLGDGADLSQSEGLTLEVRVISIEKELRHFTVNIPSNAINIKRNFRFSCIQEVEPVDRMVEEVLICKLKDELCTIKEYNIKLPSIDQQCDLFHQGKNVIDIIKEIRDNLKKYRFPPILKDGDFVQVSHISSEWNFYVRKVENVQPLEMLMADMRKFYKKHAKVTSELVIGMPYISRIRNTYYRVKISCIKEGMVGIFFVDTGRFQLVNRTNIYNAAIKHLLLPQQAIKCRLNGDEMSSCRTVNLFEKSRLTQKMKNVYFKEEVVCKNTNTCHQINIHVKLPYNSSEHFFNTHSNRRNYCKEPEKSCLEEDRGNYDEIINSLKQYSNEDSVCEPKVIAKLKRLKIFKKRDFVSKKENINELTRAVHTDIRKQGSNNSLKSVYSKAQREQELKTDKTNILVTIQPEVPEVPEEPKAATPVQAVELQKTGNVNSKAEWKQNFKTDKTNIVVTIQPEVPEEPKAATLVHAVELQSSPMHQTTSNVNSNSQKAHSLKTDKRNILATIQPEAHEQPKRQRKAANCQHQITSNNTKVESAYHPKSQRKSMNYRLKMSKENMLPWLCQNPSMHDAVNTSNTDKCNSIAQDANRSIRKQLPIDKPDERNLSADFSTFGKSADEKKSFLCSTLVEGKEKEINSSTFSNRLDLATSLTMSSNNSIANNNSSADDVKSQVVFFKNIDEFFVLHGRDLNVYSCICSYLDKPEFLEKCDHFEVSDIVAAFIDDDKKWYRAKILKPFADGTYKVLLIDIGKISNSSDCRKMYNVYENINIAAQKCALQLPSYCAAWSTSAEYKFADLLEHQKTFDIEEIDVVEGCLMVRLFIGPRCINDELALFCETKEPTELYHISHIESPASLYVLFMTDAMRLNTLNTLLANIPKIRVKEPRLGDRYIYSHCRVTMLRKTKEGKYHVLYVDYYQETYVDELYVLPSELTQMEPLIKHCQLHNADKFDYLEGEERQIFEHELRKIGHRAKVKVLDDKTPMTIQIYDKITGNSFDELLQ